MGTGTIGYTDDVDFGVSPALWMKLQFFIAEIHNTEKRR